MWHPPTPQNATILVVDDEESVRTFLQILLTKQGYDVVLREDARDLVDALRTTKPDLVLLDVMMPGVNGFDALANVREHFGELELPIIMLTARDSREDAVLGFRLGANDYLAKPPALRDLLERVNIQIKLHAAEGPRRLGQYELFERIGEGGMAYVYRARDVELDMIVALKVVRREHADDQEFLIRLRREADHLASILHPNVIRFLGVEELGQTVGLAVEFLEGRTLYGLVANERLAARIGRDVARGLLALHEAGLVHRDIKPDNIFLTDDGTTKIFDFGIAAAMYGERLTVPGMIVGTRDYMSPEQFRGEVTPACDVYALGCVLFEILTNTPAYPDTSDIGHLMAEKDKRPPRADLKGAVVSEPFAQLIASMDASDRIQTSTRPRRACADAGRLCRQYDPALTVRTDGRVQIPVPRRSRFV
jgi:serine/threonine protein kinase